MTREAMYRRTSQGYKVQLNSDTFCRRHHQSQINAACACGSKLNNTQPPEPPNKATATPLSLCLLVILVSLATNWNLFENEVVKLHNAVWSTQHGVHYHWRLMSASHCRTTSCTKHSTRDSAMSDTHLECDVDLIEVILHIMTYYCNICSTYYLGLTMTDCSQ